MLRPQLLVGTLIVLFITGMATYALYMLVKPIVQVVDARDWVEVPCTIVYSHNVKLREQRISYDYEVDGRQFHSYRQTFFHGSSDSLSDLKDLQVVVEQTPAGMFSVCFVDPEDPSRAVLMRGLTTEVAWLLVPLLMLMFCSPLVYALLGGGRSSVDLSEENVDEMFTEVMGKSPEEADEEEQRRFDKAVITSAPVLKVLKRMLVGSLLVLVAIVTVVVLIAAWNLP